MVRSVIKGLGSYVPPKVVTNDDLAGLMDTSHEWILTRTGIEERHFAEEGVYCSDLALEASRRAIADAGITAGDVDFIILATLSPDHHFPGTGCGLQDKLEIPPVACLDVRNQCTGFLYSLTVGDALVRTGAYQNVLVVGAEVHSSGLDFTNQGRDVAVLFGDGAGAVVLSPSPDPDRGLLYSKLYAEGKHAKALCANVWDISRKPYLTKEDLDQRRHFPSMDGKTVFKHAVTRLVETVKNTLETQGISREDIKYVIPHQANMRINQIVADRLGWPREMFLHNMQRYGNTTAASIPLLLDETYRNGMISKGDLLLVIAFGAGFTWGSALYRW
ncbi:MAG: ketoacyl-ACP synthase III [Proteobacteria bacterium]|nr:ketoacyl-ACP synthase III [Pseudomonadota bacterium]